MIVLWDEAINEEHPAGSRPPKKYQLLWENRDHLNLGTEVRRNLIFAKMGKMRLKRISCRNGPKRFSGRDGNYPGKNPAAVSAWLIWVVAFL
jgi:hypothetical protein